MAPEGIFLRQFRDNILNKTKAGRSFIHIYWIRSPLIARFISKSIIFRMLMRKILLRPMICFQRNLFYK